MRATYSLILSFTPLPTFVFGLLRVLAFSLVEADGRELLGQSFHFLLQRGNRRELLGLQNLLEYALMSNPVDPNSLRLPRTSIGDDGHLNLTFIRLVDVPGLVYTIEFSEDLKVWQAAADRITSVTEFVGEQMTVIARDKIPPVPGSLLFYRISVSVP